MKAHIPRTFRTGAIVDSEDVNANLQAIARDLRRAIDARYTYSAITIDMTGLVDTDTAAERTIPFRGWATAGAPDRSPVDIVGVELSIYATAGTTWTLSTTDENGTVLALAVATAGTTTEGYGASNVPLQLTVAELDFVLSGSAASTLTRATVTIHIRCDRHAQADVTPPSYVPTLIDASTSTAATAINAEIAAALAARTANVNTNNNLDVRCTAIVADNLTAAQTWRIPIGNTRPIVCCASAVGAAARSVAITDATTTITINTTGTSNIVLSTGNLGSLIPLPGNPTSTADDFVITLTPTGGAISRVILFFWWR
jgi:hypothetical protein